MKLLLSLALLLPAYAQTLIRDVDKPGLRPYQVTVTADAKADSEVWLNFPAPPAGKRLVLEHATLHIALWADQSVACELSGTVASVQGTQAAVHHFGPAQLVYATHSDSYFRINQPLRFYVDAAGRDGLPLAIHCHRQGPAMKPWPVTATLTGYLMDQPAQ